MNNIQIKIAQAKLLNERFILFNRGIVYDIEKNLMWQREDDSIKRNWQDSIDYAKQLNLDKFKDWRLPTKEELGSLIDKTKQPAINEIFKCHSHIYWSGEFCDAANAWYVSFYNGNVFYGNKFGAGYVRCGRSGF